MKIPALLLLGCPLPLGFIIYTQGISRCLRAYEGGTRKRLARCTSQGLHTPIFFKPAPPWGRGALLARPRVSGTSADRGRDSDVQSKTREEQSRSNKSRHRPHLVQMPPLIPWLDPLRGAHGPCPRADATPPQRGSAAHPGSPHGGGHRHDGTRTRGRWCGCSEAGRGRDGDGALGGGCHAHVPGTGTVRPRSSPA